MSNLRLFPFSFIDDYKILESKIYNYIKRLSNGTVLVILSKEYITIERFDYWDSVKRASFHFYAPKNKNDWDIVFKIIDLYSSYIGEYFTEYQSYGCSINIYHSNKFTIKSNCDCKICTKIKNYNDVLDFYSKELQRLKYTYDNRPDEVNNFIKDELYKKLCIDFNLGSF